MAAALALLALLFLSFVFSVGTRPAETHNIAGLANVAPLEIKAEQKSESCTEEKEEPEPTFQPLDVPLDADLQYEISVMCLEAGVPFEVEMALIEHESDFDMALVSRTDDHGLAQINRCNFGWLQKGIAAKPPMLTLSPFRLKILPAVWADLHRSFLCRPFFLPPFSMVHLAASIAAKSPIAPSFAALFNALAALRAGIYRD